MEQPHWCRNWMQAKYLPFFGALRQGHETNTYLSLPRFRIRFATKLKNSFQRLGIARPFEEDHADFSDITGRPKEQVRILDRRHPAPSYSRSHGEWQRSRGFRLRR